MSYFKPTSLTFWAGAASIACGALIGVHEAHPIGWGVDAIVNMIGETTSPAMLVANGFGLIGLRRAVGQ